MLTDTQCRFLAGRRVGHLATAGRDAAPHVVPVCFATAGLALYIAFDGKPKRAGHRLRRIANILDDPAACFIADHYDEDWAHLGWVTLRGNAEILADGTEYDAAQALLKVRYPQLAAMDITDLPVIALRIARATDWGEVSLVRAGWRPLVPSASAFSMMAAGSLVPTSRARVDEHGADALPQPPCCLNRFPPLDFPQGRKDDGWADGRQIQVPQIGQDVMNHAADDVIRALFGLPRFCSWCHSRATFPKLPCQRFG